MTSTCPSHRRTPALIQPPPLAKAPAPTAPAPATRRRAFQFQPHGNRTVASATSALIRQRETAKFFAGGLAGSLSALFTTPLEVLRTRVQASGSGRAGRSIASVARAIVKVDGLAGFYNGLGVSLVGSLPARSIYFSTYSQTKDCLRRILGREGPVVHLLSAVAAGATSNFVMSPLWVVRTRMQLGGQVYKGYVDAFGRILNQEGVQGLYRGFSASLWGTSEAAIHFVLYEHLKRIQLQRMARNDRMATGTAELSPIQYTATAAISKLVASVATYPHERVRVLMREVPKLGCAPKYQTMVQSMRIIVREEGWRALYRGMGCHLARTVPNTAIMFLSYELISKNIERRHRRKMAEVQRAEGTADQ